MSSKPHVPTVSPEWLALRQEAAIEPDLPIIDSHFHIWDFSEPPYFGAEFAADVHAGHYVTGGVFVECTARYLDEGPEALRPVGETIFVAEEAAKLAAQGDDIISGIVAWADLSIGDALGAVLDAHVAAGNGRLRGIRTRVAYDEDPAASYGAHSATPDLMAQPAYRAGAAMLAARGLALDLWGFHHQLPAMADLARALPELRIIVNHVGGPLGVGRYAGRREEVRREWLAGLRVLATCPNVAIKLGGLGISRIGLPFANAAIPASSEELAAGYAPYVHACIDAFSPARCMFGSNFPVDKTSGGHGILLNAMKRITAEYSAAERARIFSGTAAEFYRL